MCLLVAPHGRLCPTAEVAVDRTDTEAGISQHLLETLDLVSTTNDFALQLVATSDLCCSFGRLISDIRIRSPPVVVDAARRGGCVAVEHVGEVAVADEPVMRGWVAHRVLFPVDDPSQGLRAVAALHDFRVNSVAVCIDSEEAKGSLHALDAGTALPELNLLGILPVEFDGAQSTAVQLNASVDLSAVEDVWGRHWWPFLGTHRGRWDDRDGQTKREDERSEELQSIHELFCTHNTVFSLYVEVRERRGCRCDSRIVRLEK